MTLSRRTLLAGLAGLGTAAATGPAEAFVASGLRGSVNLNQQGVRPIAFDDQSQTLQRAIDGAAAAGEAGRPLRTFGGRRLRMYSIDGAADHRAAAAGRGRYARNAMVQGAAAELFKMWAVTVRARGGEMGMEVVLCLHDELLLHVPLDRADDAVALTRDCLAEAAHRWHPTSGVRFVADISVVRSWADAKG